jgi:hypothetical protein
MVKIFFKFVGFCFLQFISFALFMSATQGGKRALVILPIACLLGVVSYLILFRRKKIY